MTSAAFDGNSLELILLVARWFAVWFLGDFDRGEVNVRRCSYLNGRELRDIYVIEGEWWCHIEI